MSRSVPSIPYKQSGNLLTSELWNLGPKVLNDWLANRPAFRGFQGLVTNASTATWTAIRMDTSFIDTDGGHNTIFNNTKYTCQVAGWYWCKATLAFNGSGVFSLNRLSTAIAKNGTIIIGSSILTGWGPNQRGAANASALVQMAVGDYIEAWGRQETGGTIPFDNNSTGNSCDLSCFWVSS
jgi:hypothetical protein